KANLGPGLVGDLGEGVLQVVDLARKEAAARDLRQTGQEVLRAFISLRCSTASTVLTLRKAVATSPAASPSVSPLRTAVSVSKASLKKHRIHHRSRFRGLVEQFVLGDITAVVSDVREQEDGLPALNVLEVPVKHLGYRVAQLCSEPPGVLRALDGMLELALMRCQPAQNPNLSIERDDHRLVFGSQLL